MINTEKLKQSINIFDFLSKLNINVTSDKNTLCLWHHDKHPSMRVYSDHVHCFSCNKTADIIELVQYWCHCDFKTAIRIISQMTDKNFELNNSNEVSSSQRPIHSQLKCFKACMLHKDFKARIDCLKSMYNWLYTYTQQKINSKKIPARISKWLIEREYRLKDLLFNFSNGNILFLDKAETLSTYVKNAVPEWSRSGLFRPDESLYWFSDLQYAVVFPVFHIFENNERKRELIITSMRLRNISDVDENHPKEVEMPLHEDLKNKEISASFGFIGLAYWSQIYPEVFDFCHELNVILTESSTDFLAGCLLFKEDKTIILSAGTISKSMQFHNLELIKNCKKLILAFDNDVAGKDGANKVAQKATQIGIKEIEFYQLPSQVKDLNDLLKQKNKGEYL